jgi:hypothetical protein
MPTFHKAFKEVGIVPISKIFYRESAQVHQERKKMIPMKINKAFLFNLFLVTLVFLVVQGAFAGVVSLTKDEILKLQFLVKSSPEGKIWADTIEQQAKEALGQEPHPIAWIQTAGELLGSPAKTETQEALKDMPRLKALGLAYILTGNKDYRQKAQDYLLAWAKTCNPPANPIDATNLEPFLETYDLLRPDLAGNVRNTLDTWIMTLGQALLDSDNPSWKTFWNNWKSHRIKIVAMTAFIRDDVGLERRELETLVILYVRNLNADGTTLDFHERDALHYQVYDLEPLIRTAMIFQRAGFGDLYDSKTDQGASLHKSVAFVIPFAKGEKKHAEYVHTKVKFDLERDQNKEKGHAIGAKFDPKSALHCLELAQYFEPDLKGLVGNLAGKPDAAYPTLQILLNEITRTLPINPTRNPNNP